MTTGSILLPFQAEILNQLKSQDGLLILARGLGIRTIISNFLNSFTYLNNDDLNNNRGRRFKLRTNEKNNKEKSKSSSSKLKGKGIEKDREDNDGEGGEEEDDDDDDNDEIENEDEEEEEDENPLVFLINASNEDEIGINNEIGLRMNCIGHETGSKERERIYKNGGVLSITSRILIVDMLNSKVKVSKITGLVVLHAERVSATSIEAFIIRVFRNSNQRGFIKAFSEEPEEFTSGISPLQSVITQLKLRVVFLWPRFQVSVKKDLEIKKPKVIELHQPLSESMAEIQTAIIESMDATLAEIRRCNTNLEVDDLTFENALFRSFDIIIRARLNSIWHRVTPKTRQLVSDLTTLRRLLAYLLHFDCIAFYTVLETVLVANTSDTSSFGAMNVKSPWLFTSAADRIFSVAKRRIFIRTDVSGLKGVQTSSNGISSWVEGPTEEEEEAMREAEGVRVPKNPPISNPDNSTAKWAWLPDRVQPVLEEQPKWQLLKEVLAEIEASLFQEEISQGSNLILVMCSSESTCETLREYLATQSKPPDPKFGVRPMMKRRLKNYFFWKGALGKMTRNLNKPAEPVQNSKETPAKEQGLSAALKRKDDLKRKSNFFSKRRRVRGGGSVSVGDSASKDSAPESKPNDPAALEKEAIEIADMLDSVTKTSSAKTFPAKTEQHQDSPGLIVEDFDEDEFKTCFELLSVDDLVVIRPYLGDEDDRVLEALRPRYIIMYEVDVAFVRRVECYQTRNLDLQVVPYFLMYSDSVEEQKYLSMIRREKESFERLIRENSSMVIPLDVEARPDQSRDEDMIHTISSRLAGGRSVSNSMSKIIVDVREFRSSLPSLLHAAKFLIEPTTLIIGDYILSPDMCVERKSIADLVQSFNSGRLYQQCEMMTIHYKQPILLIEFDEKKSFTLDTYSDVRGASNKNSTGGPNETDLQAKLVLLTLSFPKLRLIWSSSPYSTAEIFKDLKLNHPEPDCDLSSLKGLEDEFKNASTMTTTTTSRTKSNKDRGEYEDEERDLSRSKLELISNGLCPVSQEVLKILPGIDEDLMRVRKILKSEIFNFNELCQLSERDLKNLLGVESGPRLFRFINHEIDRN